MKIMKGEFHEYHSSIKTTNTEEKALNLSELQI